jgi:hypothetical protein
LKKSIEGFRKLDLRVHGIVLWDDDLPQIDTPKELLESVHPPEVPGGDLAGVR